MLIMLVNSIFLWS